MVANIVSYPHMYKVMFYSLLLFKIPVSLAEKNKDTVTKSYKDEDICIPELLPRYYGYATIIIIIFIKVSMYFTLALLLIDDTKIK